MIPFKRLEALMRWEFKWCKGGAYQGIFMYNVFIVTVSVAVVRIIGALFSRQFHDFGCDGK